MTRHHGSWGVWPLVVLSVFLLGQAGPCGGGGGLFGGNDRDGDGIEDSADNCPDIANVDQADFDEDSIGDVCEDGGDGFDGGTDGDDTNNGVDPFPENRRGCGVWSGTIYIDVHRMRDAWWQCERYFACPKAGNAHENERHTANVTVLLGDQALYHYGTQVYEASGKVTYDEVNTSHSEGYDNQCELLRDESETLKDSWSVDDPQIKISTGGYPEGFDPEYWYTFDPVTLVIEPLGPRTVPVKVHLAIDPPKDGQKAHLITTYAIQRQCPGEIPQNTDDPVDHPGSVFLDLNGTYEWDPNGHDRLDVTFNDDKPKIFDCHTCCPGNNCSDSQSTIISYAIHLTRFVEADQDKDGVCDSVDNCRDMANSDQADEDGNGIGNMCDLAPLVP